MICLFAITKDRWNWAKIALLLWAAVSLTLVGVFHLIVVSPYSKIGAIVLDLALACLLLAPPTMVVWRTKLNWHKTRKVALGIAGTACACAFFVISYAAIDLANKQKDYLAAIKTEKNALECNSKEIRRIESSIISLNERLASNTTRLNALAKFISKNEHAKADLFLEYATKEYPLAKKEMEPEAIKVELENIAARFLKVSINEKDIKKQSIEARLAPQCETRFSYLIRIDFDEANIAEAVNVFAAYPPMGYPASGVVDDLRNNSPLSEKKPVWLNQPAMSLADYISEFVSSYAMLVLFNRVPVEDLPGPDWSKIPLNNLSTNLRELKEFAERREWESAKGSAKPREGRDFSAELFGPSNKSFDNKAPKIFEMSRDVAVRFSDGSSHVYKNVPIDTPSDLIRTRAKIEFGKAVTHIDGRATTGSQ